MLFKQILSPNQMAVWDDEKVWHYVSPPFLAEEGERTAVVLGWPRNTSLDASVFSGATPKETRDVDSDYNSGRDSDSDGSGR